MGLRDTLATAAATAISAIGDLARTIDYKEQDSSTTLDTTNGPTHHFDVHVGISCAVLNYSSREIDGDAIRATDEKLIIPQKNVSFTPKQGDIVEEDTDRWRVVNVGKDPAEATWVLQIRRLN